MKTVVYKLALFQHGARALCRRGSPSKICVSAGKKTLRAAEPMLGLYLLSLGSSGTVLSPIRELRFLFEGVRGGQGSHLAMHEIRFFATSPRWPPVSIAAASNPNGRSPHFSGAENLLTSHFQTSDNAPASTFIDLNFATSGDSVLLLTLAEPMQLVMYDLWTSHDCAACDPISWQLYGRAAAAGEWQLLDRRTQLNHPWPRLSRIGPFALLVRAERQPPPPIRMPPPPPPLPLLLVEDPSDAPPLPSASAPHAAVARAASTSAGVMPPGEGKRANRSAKRRAGAPPRQRALRSPAPASAPHEAPAEPASPSLFWRLAGALLLAYACVRVTYTRTCVGCCEILEATTVLGASFVAELFHPLSSRVCAFSSWAADFWAALRSPGSEQSRRFWNSRAAAAREAEVVGLVTAESG